jgi:hypothetical protein
LAVKPREFKVQIWPLLALAVGIAVKQMKTGEKTDLLCKDQRQSLTSESSTIGASTLRDTSSKACTFKVPHNA